MMKSTTEANYLGAVMNDNDKAETSQEIRRRILSTMPIFETPWYFLEQNELRQKLEMTSLQLHYH